MTNDDIRFMAQAIGLARKGVGRTAPNPTVGCVIVRKGKVIGGGYHKKAGAAHAEVVALKNCGESPGGATLYVTLEPCNHHGRTGPCTEAIIAAGVKRVVIGARDKSPKEGITGMGALKKAGLKVELSQLRKECGDLVADFHKLTATGIPYVTLKTAMTLDGKIATGAGDSRWISCEKSRRLVHAMRNRSDAILIGSETALADNPELTIRYGPGRRRPLRVILDSTLRITAGAKLVTSAHDHPTLVITTDASSPARRRTLEKSGVSILIVPASKEGVNLKAALTELGKRGVMRLLVEGGAKLSGALIDAHLVDYVVFFIAPKIVGGGRGAIAGSGVSTMAKAMKLDRMKVTQSGDDVMIEGAL